MPRICVRAYRRASPSPQRAKPAARKLLGEKAAVLAQPNDILGVEYCKAIARQAAALSPLALPRRGVGHDGGAAEGFAIREPHP